MSIQESIIGKTNLRRYREIMAVLNKNGLGFVFVKTALSRDPQKELRKEDKKPGRKSVAERIRISCEQLGPTFVKVGQILSMRTDLVTEEIAKELQKLQDDVPIFPFAEARALIESELEDTIENVYAKFDSEPVASASVSQVYQAWLHSGDRVAVKVSRPGIEKTIQTDLDILQKLARFVDNRTKYGKLYDFEGMVVELRKVMRQEMDMVHEGKNLDRFRDNLDGNSYITAPKVRWMYTTHSVLTMDFVDGIKINNIEKLDEIGADKKKIAEEFVDSLLKQILTDGFFHADPHPGNVLVRQDGRGIEYIDLGMTGELTDRFRLQLNDMVLGIATQDTRRIALVIQDMDTAGAKVNQHLFMKRLDAMMDHYVYAPLDHVNAGQLFSSIFALAGEFGMVIQSEFAMVAKALGTAQGVLELLWPGSSVLGIAESTIRDIMRNQFAPKRIAKEAAAFASAGADVVRKTPPFLQDWMQKMSEDDFMIDLRIQHLDKLDKNLERMANRISMTLVLLAVCIVMAGVVIAIGFRAGSDPELYELSIFALRAGMVIAVAIVVGLVFNMIYSAVKRS